MRIGYQGGELHLTRVTRQLRNCAEDHPRPDRPHHTLYMLAFILLVSLMKTRESGCGVGHGPASFQFGGTTGEHWPTALGSKVLGRKWLDAFVCSETRGSRAMLPLQYLSTVHTWLAVPSVLETMAQRPYRDAPLQPHDIYPFPANMPRDITNVSPQNSLKGSIDNRSSMPHRESSLRCIDDAPSFSHPYLMRPGATKQRLKQHLRDNRKPTSYKELRCSSFGLQCEWIFS